MLDKIRKLDAFTRNIIIVFAGTSLLNFINLIFQLLIAHKLTPTEFAAFNSLISIYMLVSAPLGTLQISIAKYASAFNASKEAAKVRHLISGLFKGCSILAALTLLIFWAGSVYIMGLLKIESSSLGYIFALLLASAWLSPVFLGSLQGLELFWWLSASNTASGILKLGLAFVFIVLGFNIAGAMGALLVSSVAAIAIAYFPIKKYFTSPADKDKAPYREIIYYMFPVAVSYFCFTALTTLDMVMVRYYFSAEDSGVYALAQMVGKIFLFLPGAVSIVMFPRTSGLSAQNLDTLSTLKKSLIYVFCLSISACAVYNIIPGFTLTVLTGKAYPESIQLGRLFSICMSFYTLLFILVSYFLSIKDLRFLKYLVIFTLLQVGGIALFHPSLFSVLVIMCISSVLLFGAYLFLAFKRKI
jgi:O-antigen/teichoic acid export membrane protein